MRENAIADDTSDIVDAFLKVERLSNGKAMDVQNDVAIVRCNAFAPDGMAAQDDEGTSDKAARHGNNLDRQRESTELIDQLTAVGDADELVSSRCHDFFSGEGCAATLDHVAGLINLVGAVDIDIKLWRGIEIQDSNAMGGESSVGFLAGGNCRVKGMFDFG